FHLVSGMMQTAAAMTFMDPQLSTYTASHDVLDLKLVGTAPGSAPSSTGETSDAGASSSGGGQ
ncbi:MAG TPA: hypothetical protein VFW23_00015, partial [Tepidisphaeraceae bacterium]|nr:hypothetical protein [Tepidisphaeraceae bacterium]